MESFSCTTFMPVSIRLTVKLDCLSLDPNDIRCWCSEKGKSFENWEEEKKEFWIIHEGNSSTTRRRTCTRCRLIITLWDLIVNMMVKSFLSTAWLMWALISSRRFPVLFTNDKRFTASVGWYKRKDECKQCARMKLLGCYFIMSPSFPPTSLVFSFGWQEIIDFFVLRLLCSNIEEAGW